VNVKKQLKRLRCLIVARGLDAKLAARRIDELAPRVAEVERLANEARRQAVRFAGRGNEIGDRQEATEAALFRAQERIEALLEMSMEHMAHINRLTTRMAELEAAHTVDAERIAELEQRDNRVAFVEDSGKWWGTQTVTITGEPQPQFAATYDDLETPQEPQDLGARQCPECGREFGRVRRATP
jgi:DNA repair exonuclease SbcCD ATPase subunit